MPYKFGTINHVEDLLAQGDKCKEENEKSEALDFYQRAKFSAEAIRDEYKRKALLSLVNCKIKDSNNIED